MTFDRPVPEVIRERRSVRSYRPGAADPGALQRLEASLAELPPAPFGNPVRLALVRLGEAGVQQAGKLGTYGVIRGAEIFLAGAVPAGPRAMDDFGYVFEAAILRATDLGLGTCWLGGTLRRGAFGRAVGVGEGDRVPAVSPVGAASDRRSIVDRVFRFTAGSDGRKPPEELFFEGSFGRPLDLLRSGAWAEVLQLVRLGPSASNKQPWRLLAEPERGRFRLYLQRTPGYGLLGDIDLQRVDMGIALCHFALAAAALGLPGRWSPEPDPPSAPGLEYVATWA